MGALPPGSWLAVAHPASDIQADQLAQVAGRLNQMMSQQSFLRSKAEVTRFFDGLDLIEPGVVPLNRWHVDPGDPGPDIAAYCGLAIKA
jgi:hypothetical protein